MANRSAILAVRVVTDASKAAAGFDQSASTAERWQSRINKASVVAGAALAGVAAAGWDSVKAAEAVASSNAAVANVFESMGYAEATDRVLAYADALEQQLGVDENVIKATQAKLATFDNIAATADTAGGAFDRATLAAMDLAAAGFGSAESNAAQLGKALNDPINGLTALTRSGVTFTEAEQDKIRAMQESGDILGAQNVLLEAVEKQVGGTAEATADDTARMALAFGEVKEEIGSALLPVLSEATGYVQRFAEWAKANSQTLLTLGGVIAGVSAAIIALNIAMRVARAVQTVWAVATKAVTAAQWLLNAAMSANPIGIIIALIVGLVAAVVLAYQRSETFREIVQKVFAAISNAVRTAIDWIKTKFEEWKAKYDEIRKGIADFVKGVRDRFNDVRNAIANAINRARDAVSNAVSRIRGFFSGVFEAITRPFTRARDIILSVWERIKSGIRTAVNFIKGLVNTVIRGFNSAINLANKLPGVNIPTISPLSVEPAGRTYYAPAGVSPMAGRTTTGLPVGRMAVAGPTIVVNGALDPDAVARQLKRILDGHARRVGTVAA